MRGMGIPGPDRAARISRRIPFLVALLLLAALAFAVVAQAFSVVPAPTGASAASTLTSVSPRDDEEGEECGELECEEEDEEGWDPGGEPPAQCLLRSAQVKAAISAPRQTFQLTARYTTFEPTKATLDARLSGGSSLHVQLGRQHLTGGGVLRLSEHLSEAKAENALDAKAIAVEFHLPGTPAACRAAFLRRLKVKQAGEDETTWKQVGSIFGGS